MTPAIINGAFLFKVADAPTFFARASARHAQLFIGCRVTQRAAAVTAGFPMEVFVLVFHLFAF